jgi:hypothetical protein
VEKATFALESAISPDYLKKQPVQEIDEFLLKTVQYVSKNPNLSVLKGLKTLLGQVVNSCFDYTIEGATHVKIFSGNNTSRVKNMQGIRI